MCGIAGFIDCSGDIAFPRESLRDMGSAIAHRGPDGSGEWFDPQARVGLAHRRLAIVDLSKEGAQPMESACGRWVAAFNGEIYNYRSLRRELEEAGVADWRGQSDTEVLLASIARWGLLESLKRFNGMFALALWDRRDRCLTLARDRFGEKPLYYGWIGPVLAFASELKALRTLPSWNPEIDRDSVGQLMRFSYIAAPDSIFRGVRKLPPGSLASFPANASAGHLPRPDLYWQPLDVIACSRGAELTDGPESIVDVVASELDRAVALRMNSDVPLGAFLSGGIDSSVVVAAMQAQSRRPVRTFSIGFRESGFDESTHAKRIAGHIGTDHTEFIVGAGDALDVIPALPTLYDEPFADSSQIPTYLVSRLARSHVTVALSGDGGDELFGGYNRHYWAPRIWRVLRLAPAPLRKALANVIRAVPTSGWDSLFDRAARYLPSARHRLAGYKLHKLAGVMMAGTPAQFYQQLAGFWLPSDEVVPGASGGSAFLLRDSEWPKDLPYRDLMMAIDALTYLPDDILVKVDRATMAVSLEGRAPFLDPDLFALCWRIPPRLKIRDGVGKWILRQVLYRRVPQSLIDRPKMGFGLPIGDWLTGPLREWAESLLADDAIRKSGLLNPVPIRAAWASQLSGNKGFEYHLWNVLTFQSWLMHESNR